MTKCEVFSRVVGYYRPVSNWNEGKIEEFKFRKEFTENKAIAGHFDKADAKVAIAAENK